MDRDWHSSKALQKAVLEFHQECAYFPKDDVAKAQKQHTQTMEKLCNRLTRAGVAVRFEYTGSTYEGIKVASSTMEFDVMVILSPGGGINVEEIRPGWVKLKPTGNTNKFRTFMKEGSPYLHTDRATSYFNGELQKAINQDLAMQGRIRLRKHGPAIQMDVYADESGGTLEYSVDMVPSFNIPGFGWFKSYFVAKPFKDDELDENYHTTVSWRRSASLDEKSLIRDIDRGNECRKQCMRIFKVLRDSEPGLHGISSYIIKTAVLSLSRDQYLAWGQTNLAKRFINVLQYLAKCLEDSRMPNFFIPEMNLLEDYSSLHLQNMYTRLRELIRSEKFFMNALESASRREKYTLESMRIQQERGAVMKREGQSNVFWKVFGGMVIGLLSLVFARRA